MECESWHTYACLGLELDVVDLLVGQFGLLHGLSGPWTAGQWPMWQEATVGMARTIAPRGRASEDGTEDTEYTTG